MSRPALKIPENLGDALAFYAIYKNPSDYPGKFVVRAHYSGGNVPLGQVAHSKECTVHETLCEARDAVPLVLVFTPAHQKDDPCIEEVWM